jgi:hypothetical protein
VGLLFLGCSRPGGTAVVGQLVEPESGRALLDEEGEVVVSAPAPTLRTLSDAASDVVFLVVGSGGVDGSGVWGRRAHLFPCMTSRRAQRQPRAGATWVRMLSITWVL